MGENNRHNFDDLVAAHGDSIYRLCKAYLGASTEVDDLHQEVLVNIWKALPKFRGEAKLSTWIYRITVNTSISYRRKQVKESALKSEYFEPAQLADDQTDKQQKIDRESQYERLLESLELLKPNHRVIIGLYLEGLSYKEIAEVTGRDTNYVGVNITRIKEKLTKLLKP